MATQDQARRPSAPMAPQETPGSAADQGAAHNSMRWRKFAEPRGWSVKWEGSALSKPGNKEPKA